MDKYGFSVRVKDKTGALMVYASRSTWCAIRPATARWPFPRACSTARPYQPGAISSTSAWSGSSRASRIRAPPNSPIRRERWFKADRYDLWCQDAANWVSEEGVIHRYYDDWYLTGLDVREDRGVEAAILYEDPTYAGRNPQYEENLWRIANNLQDSFLAGRDEQRRAARHHR